MAHFMGTVQGHRGEGSRLGTKDSGLKVVAASWEGAIEVTLTHDDATGEDRFEVSQRTWHGKGISTVLASGVVGK